MRTAIDVARLRSMARADRLELLTSVVAGISGTDDWCALKMRRMLKARRERSGISRLISAGHPAQRGADES